MMTLPREPQAKLIVGDCVEKMAQMPENSVDAIVTDPPYHLSFMGKTWDHAPTPKESQAMHLKWAREALRVLKPGGYMLAFSGTRTYHRMVCAIEDAGFEIRDSVQWIYGSGFPKSLDVSKAIDKMAPREGMFSEFAKHFAERRKVAGLSQKDVAQHFLSKTGGITGCVWNWENGANVPTLAQWRVLQSLLRLSDKWLPLIERVEAEREVVGNASRNGKPPQFMWGEEDGQNWDVTAPATDAAKEWQGWGTALKPAHEPIVLARKPLSESSVARNVLEHGTGAINVDGTRVGSEPLTTWIAKDGASSVFGQVPTVEEDKCPTTQHSGRWPANLILSHVGGPNGCKRVGEKRVKGAGSSNGYPHGPKGHRFKFDDAPNQGNDYQGHADPDGYETVEAYECVEGCPVRALDEQSGNRPGDSVNRKRRRSSIGAMGYGSNSQEFEGDGYTDSGGASRFFQTFEPDTEPGFKYTAKASRRERNAGLEGMPEKTPAELTGRKEGSPGLEMAIRPKGGTTNPYAGQTGAGPRTNHHPTVKPIALMRYLIRMITPPGGTVLDPFCGSGSTLCAATLEGFNAIGIEMDEEYAEIASRRVAYWSLPEYERPRYTPTEPQRNTYGLASTRTIPRCTEHDASVQWGTTVYKCGCPMQYENREGSEPAEAQDTWHGTLF